MCEYNGRVLDFRYTTRPRMHMHHGFIDDARVCLCGVCVVVVLCVVAGHKQNNRRANRSKQARGINYNEVNKETRTKWGMSFMDVVHVKANA